MDDDRVYCIRINHNFQAPYSIPCDTVAVITHNTHAPQVVRRVEINVSMGFLGHGWVRSFHICPFVKRIRKKSLGCEYFVKLRSFFGFLFEMMPTKTCLIQLNFASCVGASMRS